MLKRSINGETPEGAVPVEDRGPNTEADIQSAYNNVPVGVAETAPQEGTRHQKFYLQNFTVMCQTGKAKPFNTKYCINREQQ